MSDQEASRDIPKPALSEKSHFERYIGFRPKDVSKDMPTYYPERDFSQMGNVLAMLIYDLANKPLTFYAEVSAKMELDLVVETESGLKLGPEIRDALDYIIKFAEAGRGETIDGSVSLQDPEEFLTYTEALDLIKKSDRRAMVIVLSMLGFRLLDMLFFAARQDRKLGRRGKYTIDEMFPIINMYSSAILNDEPTDKVGIDQLKNSIRYLISLGYTGSQISEMVNRIVVETHLNE